MSFLLVQLTEEIIQCKKNYQRLRIVATNNGDRKITYLNQKTYIKVPLYYQYLCKGYD